MKLLSALILLPSLFLILPSMAQASSLQGQLTLTGSSTVAPLISEMAKAFEKKNPEVRINVQTGGSTRGVIDVQRGLSEIGMVSRDLSSTEQKALQNFTIAKDGIAMIVHGDNPIKELSREDVIAIYTGKINNWKKVGGVDAPITVINKAEGRSTLELFLHYYGLKNSQIKADIVIGDNEQANKMVVGNPHALAYVSIGSAEYSVAAGRAMKLLPLGGVDATTENLKSGSFPLARPLNLVTLSKPEGLAKAFIDFAMSEEQNSLIERQFFAPIR